MFFFKLLHILSTEAKFVWGAIQFYGQVDFVAIITVAAEADDDRQERNVEAEA